MFGFNTQAGQKIFFVYCFPNFRLHSSMIVLIYTLNRQWLAWSMFPSTQCSIDMKLILVCWTIHQQTYHQKGKYFISRDVRKTWHFSVAKKDNAMVYQCIYVITYMFGIQQTITVVQYKIYKSCLYHRRTFEKRKPKILEAIAIAKKRRQIYNIYICIYVLCIWKSRSLVTCTTVIYFWYDITCYSWLIKLVRSLRINDVQLYKKN